MRFVPVLPNLTQAWDTAGTAYSGPSWLYCRAEFSYQAALGVTLPPYFARREPTERRRLRAVGREREKRTIVITHRIATAWPRARVLTATLAGMLAAAFVAVPALAQQHRLRQRQHRNRRPRRNRRRLHSRPNRRSLDSPDSQDRPDSRDNSRPPANSRS